MKRTKKDAMISAGWFVVALFTLDFVVLNERVTTWVDRVALIACVVILVIEGRRVWRDWRTP